MTYQDELVVETAGRGTTNISAQVEEVLGRSGAKAGTCNVFIQHTSASLLLTENADPDVRRDLEAYFARLVPDGDALFVHDAEGPDDMPAHVRTVLTESSLTVPFRDGRLLLGTWQGIYLWEHRLAPHRRRVIVTVTG